MFVVIEEKKKRTKKHRKEIYVIKKNETIGILIY
jgi:hypothetical protein